MEQQKGRALTGVVGFERAGVCFFDVDLYHGGDARSCGIVCNARITNYKYGYIVLPTHGCAATHAHAVTCGSSLDMHRVV